MKPDDRENDWLDRIDIASALARLSPIRRDIIVLYYWRDLGYDEIAAIIGPRYRGRKLTGSACRYHAKKAMEILRIYLGESK